MPPTKGGKRPPKGGKGSGKGKRMGSGKGSIPAKSGSLTGAQQNQGRKRRARRASSKWSAYIHKTLRQVDKEKTISARAMTIMGSFVEDMFDKIQSESVNVAKINNIKTLSAREVQTSARLLLPGELAKHAMSEGTKSVAKYQTEFANLKEGRHD